MEAFQNFRLVSKSWKFAVETTKFYGPPVHGILTEIAIKLFGKELECPIIYHKLFFFFFVKPEHSDLLVYNVFLAANNCNAVAKLVSKNMKGLRSITICGYLDFKYGNEIYEKFIIEFSPNSRNTLCQLDVAKPFLPNVCFPNLTKRLKF